MKRKDNKSSSFVGIGIVLVAVVASIMLLSSCSSKDLTEGVVLGRSVALAPENIVFWGIDNYLCSGLIDSSGSITELVVEAQVVGNISTVAVADKKLYIAGRNGIFTYTLKELSEGGTVMPKKICEDDVDDGFEIFDGKLYYSYGTTLFSTELSGGDAEEIAEDVDDYDVTTEGIIYTDSDGGIYLISPDGAENKRLMKTDGDCTVRIAGDTIYYRCKGDDDVYSFKIGDEEATKIATDEDLSLYSCIWANESYFLYETDGYEVNLIDLSTNKETEAEDAVIFPDKHEGIISGNMLYGYDKYKKELYEYNLEKNSFKSNRDYDVLGIGSNPNSNTSAKSNSTGNAYDITENINRYAGEGDEDMLSTKYFNIVIPNDIEWEWMKNSNTNLSIYYSPAIRTGNGGCLVTISAYDLSDNSYKQLPSYKVAGVSKDKRYVAVFPTDVQFDSEDSVQKTEYNKLFSYVKKIDQNAAKGQSPFTLEN